jgi:hypothetical protein
VSELSSAIPDAQRLHAAREKLKAESAGRESQNDDGINLTKLLKPTTGKPLVVLVACGSYSPITNMQSVKTFSGCLPSSLLSAR